jgi:chromosome segregation ATPase
VNATIEKNVYQEFEELLHDMTQDITNQILLEVVDSPLSELLKKYEKQIPKVSKNNQELQKLIEAINAAKLELTNSIPLAAQEMSKVVIEQHVVSKLREQFGQFDQHLAAMGTQSEDIHKSISNLKATERHLTDKLEHLTAEVATRVLKETILADFNDLYRQYHQIMPSLETTNQTFMDNINGFQTALQSLNDAHDQHTEMITQKVVEAIDYDLKRTLKAYVQLGIEIKSKLSTIDRIVENQLRIENQTKTNHASLEQQFNNSKRSTLEELGMLQRRLEFTYLEGNKKILKRVTVFGSIHAVLLAGILYLLIR